MPVPGGTSLSGNLPCSSDHGTPTSVAFTSTDPAHIVASSRSGDTILYDLEAGSALLTLESRGSSGKEHQRSSMFSCGLGDPRLSEPQRASHRLSGCEWEGDQVPSASLMDTTVLAGLRGEGVSGTLPSAPWTV